MKLVLINSVALVFAFFSSGTNHAQNFITKKSEKEFEQHLINEVAKYNDTLCKTKQSGILFIKFLIKEDGIIDSIKLSIKQPAILISVLTRALQQFKFGAPDELNKETKYVSQVFYDSVPELTLPVTAEKILNQVPDINLTVCFHI